MNLSRFLALTAALLLALPAAGRAVDASERSAPTESVPVQRGAPPPSGPEVLVAQGQERIREVRAVTRDFDAAARQAETAADPVAERWLRMQSARLRELAMTWDGQLARATDVHQIEAINHTAQQRLQQQADRMEPELASLCQVSGFARQQMPILRAAVDRLRFSP